MDWVGRRVFERGFWKGADDRRAELEVLDKMEVADATDGVIEEDCDDNRSVPSEKSRRWIRIFRSAIGIAGVVKGFTFLEDTRKWSIEGTLLEKVERWKEEEMMKREAEEQKHMGRRFSGDSMEVDEEDTLEDVTDSEDDENDAEEVKALKVGFLLHTMKVTKKISNNIRLGVSISGVCCSPPLEKSSLHHQAHVDHIHGNHGKVLRQLPSRLSQAIPPSSSIPISSSLHCPCSHLSWKAFVGLSLYLCLSSWNWMGWLPMCPHLVMQRKPRSRTSHLTCVRMPRH